MSTTIATLNHGRLQTEHLVRALQALQKDVEHALERLEQGDVRGWSIKDQHFREINRAQGALDVLASTVLAGVSDDDRDEVSQSWVEAVLQGQRDVYRW